MVWPEPCDRIGGAEELKLLADALETPSGQKRLSKLLGQSHPKEYRAVI